MKEVRAIIKRKGKCSGAACENDDYIDHLEVDLMATREKLQDLAFKYTILEAENKQLKKLNKRDL